MKCLKVENGVVANVAIFEKRPKEWLAAPDGVGVGWVDNGDGTFGDPNPAPSPTAKEARDVALAQLVHDFSDGRVIQTRPQDERNIRNAIEYLEVTQAGSMNWIMADNSIQAVSAADLLAALTAGRAAAVVIWNEYMAEVSA